MKVNAAYIVNEHDDGRITHGIDHEGGGFIVSSKKVGIAIQNFLNHATLADIDVLHSHLLREYARQFEVAGELEKMDAEAIYQRGKKDGRNAASWLIDGNTPDPYKVLDDFIAGIDSGDPAILDQLPTPRYSGEWADDPTWEDICKDELDSYDDDNIDHQEMMNTYDHAFHEGVEEEIREMHSHFKQALGL